MTRRRVSLVVMLTFLASALLAPWSLAPFRIVAPVAFLLAAVELVLDLQDLPDAPPVAWLGVPVYVVAGITIAADLRWVFLVVMAIGLVAISREVRRIADAERTS